MSDARSPVLITGIGLVSSLGQGLDAHLAILTGPDVPQPVVDTQRFAPFLVHPLPPIDWSAQIPKKDQRQMEAWQKLGVYAAGLALDDAGLPGHDEARARVDMIVAAGGGERDPAVDSLVLSRTRGLADPQSTMNAVLSSELRPTLFLAQLSNLLAGNISIVHKVTGSSRTFMGEEGAGISAVETAAARIASGQSEICLVGGAFSAERQDLLLNYELGDLLLRNDWRPAFSREGRGGLTAGSVGAFLVLESAEHAAKRNAMAYAELVHVGSDRGARDDAGAFEARIAALLSGADTGESDSLVLSGATGLTRETVAERAALATTLPGAIVRAYSNAIGHSFEAHFPAGLALAAAAIARGAILAPTDRGEEHASTKPAETALVTTVGHMRGEGVARLRKATRG